MRCWGRGSNLMKCSTTTSHSHDMLSNPLLAFALFCLPAIAIVATGHYRIGDGWRTAVWTAALSIMGTACLANAVRCGRVHCYITGPFPSGDGGCDSPVRSWR